MVISQRTPLKCNYRLQYIGSSRKDYRFFDIARKPCRYHPVCSGHPNIRQGTVSYQCILCLHRDRAERTLAALSSKPDPIRPPWRNIARGYRGHKLPLARPKRPRCLLELRNWRAP